MSSTNKTLLNPTSSIPKTSMFMSGETVVLLENDITTHSSGEQFYPKDENGNEFYPLHRGYAHTIGGIPKYALTAKNEIIFPVDAAGNEFYLQYRGNDVETPRYAKQKNGFEIYPKSRFYEKQIELSFEHILMDRYAKDEKNVAYYPLDEYGNEYLRDLKLLLTGEQTEKDIFPIGYPILYDETYYMPLFEYRPYMSKTLKPLMSKDRLTVQIEPRGDFKTMLLSARPARTVPNRKRLKFDIPYLKDYLEKPNYSLAKIVATQLPKKGTQWWIYIGILFFLLICVVGSLVRFGSTFYL